MRILRRHRLEFERISPAANASFYTRIVSGSSIPFFWHHHPEIEIAFVATGHGQRFVGDSVENFTDGDLAVLGGNLPHCWNVDGRLHSYVIQFLPNFLEGVFTSAPELRPIASLIERAKRGLLVTGRSRIAAGKRIEALFEHQPGSWRQLHDLIGLLGTLAECDEMRPLAMSSEHPTITKEANRRINDVFALIQRGDEIPSQAEVAKSLQLSPQSFSRFFKRCVGKPFNQCVSEQRINAACRALMESDRPIIDIAFAAGFGNLSNFNRRFRRLKRMTPSEFRAAHRKSLDGC